MKKRSLRCVWGYIFSQRRLRPTQWPPRRSMGVVNSGNALGLNSRPLACGRSARGRREAAFGGIARGTRAAHREPPQARLGLWPPRSPGPLGHPPRPSPSLVGLRRLFGTFFWPTGGVPAPEGQSSAFRRSGRNWGSMGLERCCPGPPNGPFGWPHSRFDRARYFNADPRSGYGAARPPP